MFSFLPMSSSDKIFISVFLAFIGCFFFSNFGWIILFNILFRLSTVSSLSIGGRYTIWIIGIVSFFVLLLLLRRTNNFFFLYLRILLDPLRMPFWIERILSASSSSGFNPEGLYILFGIVSKQIFLHITNLFKLSLNHKKMLHKTFNIINCST